MHVEIISSRSTEHFFQEMKILSIRHRLSQKSSYVNKSLFPVKLRFRDFAMVIQVVWEKSCCCTQSFKSHDSRVLKHFRYYMNPPTHVVNTLSSVNEITSSTNSMHLAFDLDFLHRVSSKQEFNIMMQRVIQSRQPFHNIMSITSWKSFYRNL